MLYKSPMRRKLSRGSLQSRRRFLTAVGASSLTIPFLRALPSYAQDASAPRYLILLFSPNGVIRHLWGADATGPGAGDFELRPYLAPLAAHKEQMSILWGFEGKAAGQGSHEEGMASLWTGVSVQGKETLAKGASIDQLIAAECQFPTPYSSLEFRVKSQEELGEGPGPASRMIYAGDGAYLDPRDNPFEARDALFAGIEPSNEPQAPSGPSDAQIQRTKLYAHLDAELGRLIPKMSCEDRIHLEALRDGWNTMNERLDTTTNVGAGCTVPNVTTTDPQDFPARTDQMIDLLTMSLACDLTRVSSLQFSMARTDMVAPWLDIANSYHEISHQAPATRMFFDDDNPSQAELDSIAGSAGVIEQLTKFSVFWAEKVALLCDRLAQMPASNGRSLLDQCVICWGNELDNGSQHSHGNLPFVLLGGGGGSLKTNQIVRSPVISSEPGSGARAHNDVLVTLAHAMGCTQINSVGDPEFNQGPILEALNV